MLALLLLAAPPADPWAKAVRVSFDPPEARPGQTVTVKLTVTLPAGHHTYPTRQPEKAAADFVTKLTFPDPGPVVFVGDVADPPKFATHADPDLGLKALRTVSGEVTFSRQLVVNPRQPAGPLTVTLPELRLPVCTADGCLPPRKLKPGGTLTVLPGPVPVEAKHAEAVRKAVGPL